MSAIQPHQQRVIEEKADLDEKDRLNRQHAAMRTYSGVLRERIEAFES